MEKIFSSEEWGAFITVRDSFFDGVEKATEESIKKAKEFHSVKMEQDIKFRNMKKLSEEKDAETLD